MITDLLQRFIAKAETHVVGEPPYGSSREIILETLGSNQFHGLDVKASFGMGRATAVPWIGFFDYGQKTEKGIYPVFLYFKEQRRLVLAYGVSETHTPDQQWPNLEGKQTVREYFAQHDLGIPARYGNSFVQSVYDKTSELDEAEVERDLDAVISDFRSAFNNRDKSNPNGLIPSIVAALQHPDIRQLIADSDFYFEKARRTLLDFESFEITAHFLNQLWAAYDTATGDFNAKLAHFSSDSAEHRLLLLMGRLISYCDMNAANKSFYNEYADKRTLAKIGIRQGNWIRSLINYKLNGNSKQGIPAIIGNALTYLGEPTAELSMLSEKHRELVSRNLLGHQEYEKELFVGQILDFFRSYSIVPQNQENLTRIISTVLYDPDVKALWFEGSIDEDGPDQPAGVPNGRPDLTGVEFGRLGFEDAHRSIITAIRTKPFLLLAGLSGTGKSRLVRTLAFMTCFDLRLRTNSSKPGNFELITVKPNWHDSTELIGYVSRISGEKYISTAFLKFVAKAWQFPHVPFFLCLDEMNLAPVEQYFAEYLSILETRTRDGESLRTDFLVNSAQFENPLLYKNLLADLGLRNEGIFSEGISLPTNLVVVGTVNMDETTHSFSRKVLDRAMTFEMNFVDLEEGLSGLSSDWSYPENFVDPEQVIARFTGGAEVVGLYEESARVLDYLKRVNSVLEGTPFKIAYRVRDEFLIYCYYSGLFENRAERWLEIALDELTTMKILSRIEGDETKTLRVLSDFDRVLNENFAKTSQKLQEMRKRLHADGYTSFWT